MLDRCVEVSNASFEDPLSEELLRGTFEGKNVIRVEVIEQGDQKQLKFNPSFEESAEPEEKQEPVAVGAGDEDSSDSSDS